MPCGGLFCRGGEPSPAERELNFLPSSDKVGTQTEWRQSDRDSSTPSRKRSLRPHSVQCLESLAELTAPPKGRLCRPKSSPQAELTMLCTVQSRLQADFSPDSVLATAQLFLSTA